MTDSKDLEVLFSEFMHKSKMSEIRLIAGTSNMPLAEAISKYLNIPLVGYNIGKFASGEINIELNENIRNMRVYIIQTCNYNVNDCIMETMLLLDTCRRSDAENTSVIYAFYPYSRSDKKDKPRVPIGAKLIANMLTCAGCHRIITFDLHASQIQGFTDMPFDNIYATKLHVENLKQTIFKDMTVAEINEKYVLVGLDVGCNKRIKDYSDRLQLNFALCDKTRDYSKPGTIIKSEIIGQVSEKIAICVDDIIDTAGTLIAGIETLVNKGIKGAIVIATHGIFSGSAVEKLNACNIISKIIVTNTINQIENLKKIPKLEVIEISAMLGEVIKRIQIGGSISELLK